MVKEHFLKLELHFQTFFPPNQDPIGSCLWMQQDPFTSHTKNRLTAEEEDELEMNAEMGLHSLFH